VRRSPAAAAARGSESDSTGRGRTYLVARVVEVGQVLGAVVEELFNAHRDGRGDDHLTDTDATRQAPRMDGCKRMVIRASFAREWDGCRVLSLTVLRLCVCVCVCMCVRARANACLPVLGREMAGNACRREPGRAKRGAARMACALVRALASSTSACSACAVQCSAVQCGRKGQPALAAAKAAHSPGR
jgi:hypothetical protein